MQFKDSICNLMCQTLWTRRRLHPILYGPYLRRSGRHCLEYLRQVTRPQAARQLEILQPRNHTQTRLQWPAATVAVPPNVSVHLNQHPLPGRGVALEWNRPRRHASACCAHAAPRSPSARTAGPSQARLPAVTMNTRPCVASFKSVPTVQY